MKNKNTNWGQSAISDHTGLPYTDYADENVVFTEMTAFWGRPVGLNNCVSFTNHYHIFCLL